MLYSYNLPKDRIVRTNKAAQLREIAEEGYPIPKTAAHFS
jgi:hypothetical protein